MINLSKTYRTKEGNRVRGLQKQYRAPKVILHGEIRNPGTHYSVIVGQVFMHDSFTDELKWCVRVWDELGRDLQGCEQHDLVEHTKPKVQQPQLF